MDVYRALSNLIENATSEALNAPDMNAMREVSEIVRSRTDMPKEAIKQIHNRLMKKDKKVTMLSLELLEYLSYTCEMTLYNQIATREFMMRIGALLKSHDSDDLVKKRICCLIKCWREIFHKDLQILFFQFYDNVIQKGFDIPSNYNSPYANLKGTVGSSSNNSSSSFNKPASTGPSSLNKPPPSNNSNNNNNQKLSGPKQQLKNDLENIKQNITLVNEMIDNQDPRGNVDQNSALSDLIQVLKTSEKNMQTLIEQLAAENDESLLELSLQLNDDIQATFERHQSLKRHMKPKPFRGRAVEEEVMQQISQLEVGTKPQQQTASSASIFSDTAQALSQGLAKTRIPPPQNFQPPQGFQPPQQQQQQQVQQQQPPKQTNILDLFDDDEPPITIPQKVNVQVPPPQNQQQSGNLIDMFDNSNAGQQQQQQPPVNNNFNNQPPVNNFNQPPVNNFNQPPANNFNQPPINNFNQPPVNNFNQPPANNFNQPPPANNNFATSLGSLYNQSAQNNNNQQNPQGSKYSAFNTMSSPPPNNNMGVNMGYNTQPMGQYNNNNNPNMGGYGGNMGGMNNNMGMNSGMGGMNNNPMGGMGGGYNTNPNMGGYGGMGMNNGMGVNNNNPNTGFNTNMNMGYGGANTFNPPPMSGGFGSGLPSSNAAKKDAFDDLDEFSITTTTSNNNKPPVQQQQSQPVQSNTQAPDFDLF